MNKPSKKIVIITGAGSGIGQAIAIRFAAAGMHVVLAGRRLETLKKVSAQIQKMGGQSVPLSLDVSDRLSVKTLIDRTLEAFGQIDILVNNAGINTQKRNLKEIKPEDWDRVITINLTGAFNVFRAVLPQMEKQQDGLVINISSISGKRAGLVGGAAYSASKFGLSSLTQSINAEFRETGIRACCIYPGEVDTPILQFRPIPISFQKRKAALLPEDIAATAIMVADLPARAIVEEITIFPRQFVSR